MADGSACYANTLKNILTADVKYKQNVMVYPVIFMQLCIWKFGSRSNLLFGLLS